jgi:hypothetical protein
MIFAKDVILFLIGGLKNIRRKIMCKERIEYLTNKMYYGYLDGDETKEYIEYINELLKENQQLKEVLDEIREYIDGVITIWKTNPSAIATLDLEYLLQQIDKVKE